jgi:hypothetical protein
MAEKPKLEVIDLVADTQWEAGLALGELRDAEKEAHELWVNFPDDTNVENRDEAERVAGDVQATARRYGQMQEQLDDIADTLRRAFGGVEDDDDGDDDADVGGTTPALSVSE